MYGHVPKHGFLKQIFAVMIKKIIFMKHKYNWIKCLKQFHIFQELCSCKYVDKNPTKKKDHLQNVDLKVTKIPVPFPGARDI